MGDLRELRILSVAPTDDCGVFVDDERVRRTIRSARAYGMPDVGVIGYEPSGSERVDRRLVAEVMVYHVDTSKRPVLFVECGTVFLERPTVLESTEAELGVYLTNPVQMKFATSPIYILPSRQSRIFLHRWLISCDSRSLSVEAAFAKTWLTSTRRPSTVFLPRSYGVTTESVIDSDAVIVNAAFRSATVDG